MQLYPLSVLCSLTGCLVLVQVWNEPDLTNYFGAAPESNTFFSGNAEDYNAMYLASNNGLRVCTLSRHSVYEHQHEAP